SGASVFTGSQVLEAGGSASTTTISGGIELVSSGGTDLGARVRGGTQNVFGLASNVTVFSGVQDVQSGGTASGTIVSAGDATGHMQVESGGLAVSAVVLFPQGLLVFGGTASATHINGGGEHVYAGLDISAV